MTELEAHWLYANTSLGADQGLHSDTVLCTGAENFINIDDQQILPGSSFAVITLTNPICLHQLEIYNKQATKVILNIDGWVAEFIGKIAMVDDIADLVIISNSGLMLSNITTENINSISIYGREYLGIDLSNYSIQLGGYALAQIQIEKISTPYLSIDGSRVTLIGNITAQDYMFNIGAVNIANYFSLNASLVENLVGESLRIFDHSDSLGLYLKGNYQFASNFNLTSTNLYFGEHSQFRVNGTAGISLKEVFRNDGEFVTSILELSSMHVFNKGKIYTDLDAQFNNTGAFLQQSIIASEGNVTVKAGDIQNLGNIIANILILEAENNSVIKGSIIANEFISKASATNIIDGKIAARVITYSGNDCYLTENAEFKTISYKDKAGNDLAAKDIVINCINNFSDKHGASVTSGCALNITTGGEINIFGNFTGVNDIAIIGNIILMQDGYIIFSTSGGITLFSNNQIFQHNGIISAKYNITGHAHGTKPVELWSIAFREGSQVISDDGWVIFNGEGNVHVKGAVIKSHLGTNIISTKLLELTKGQITDDKFKILSDGTVSLKAETAIIENGVIVGSIVNLNVNSGTLINNGFLKADNLEVLINAGDFINNAAIEVNGLATWNLANSNSVYFNKGSLTKVGSFHFISSDGTKIAKVECIACTFEAKDELATSEINAGFFNIKPASYSKQGPFFMRDISYTHTSWCGKGCWFTEYPTFKEYYHSHSKEGYGNIKIKGGVTFKVNNIDVHLSSLTVEGLGNFQESGTNLLLRTETVTRFIDCKYEGGFGESANNLRAEGYQVTNNAAFKVLSTLTSVFHVKKATGEIANLIAKGISTGDSIPQITDSSANELSLAATNMLALSNQGNNLVIIKPNFNNEVSFISVNGGTITTTTINLEEFFRHQGLDLSIVLDFQGLNPLIFEYNPITPLLAATAGQENGYQVHYLWRMNPMMAEYIQSGFAPESFLTALSFQAGGLVPVLNDGNLLEKVLDDAVFGTVGRLAGVSSVNLVKQLSENAITYYGNHPQETPGRSLVQFDYDNDLPMIWPVWKQNCQEHNVEKCLSFQIKLNKDAIKNMIEGAAFDTETTDLKINGNVLIDSFSQMKVGQQLKLDVAGHVINLGKIAGGEQDFQVKGNFINLGKIQTIGDLVISALNVLLSGAVKSGKGIEASALQELVIKTLYTVTQYSGYGSRTIKSEITLAADIQAAGRASFTSKGDATIIGASVIGNDVYIKSSNGKVSIVPVKLYNEVTSWGKRYYNSYKALSLYRSTIESSTGNMPGNIEISADGGILLSGITSKSAADTVIQTLGNTIVESPSEYIQIESWYKKSRGGIAGLCGGSKSVSTFSSIANAVVSAVYSIKNLVSTSGEDQYWIGADVKAYSAKLKAGSPEHEAMIILASAQNVKEIKVITKTSGFSLSFDNGMMNVVTSSTSTQGQQSLEQVPTIFQVEDQFIGYSNGKWVQLSSNIQSNGTVIIDAKDIVLDAAPDIKVSYANLDKSGFGIGFSDKKGEFAIKAALWKERTGSVTAEQNYNHVSSIVASFLRIKSETLTSYGALLDAAIMDLDAKITFHGVLKNSLTQTATKELMEAGLKLGIKSNIGQIFESSETIMEQDYSRPEAYVNSAFAAIKLYDNILDLLSKNTNHGISGGIWFYASYVKEKVHSVEYTAVPTIIHAAELLTSTSEELRLIGTQINAYNAFIKTKYLEARNTENERTGTIDRKEFDVEIPISGNVSPSVGGLINKANQYQKVILNTNINIAGHLSMEVQGHADLRGVYISAKSIDAFFESLLLESVQDVIENKSTLTSLGLNFNSEGITGISPGFQKGRHSSHIVQRISAIIGEESANIVVANALRLNGAMIASAQRDPSSGKYTDHGNLVLKVGELFIQHIFDFDNGYTLGASMSFKQKMDGQPKTSSFEPIVGGHKKEGWTKSTSGNGKVDVTSGAMPEGLNRDVNSMQNKETEYDIHTMRGYFNPGRDSDEVGKGIPRDENGNIDFRKVGQGICEAIVNPFGISFEYDEKAQVEHKQTNPPADLSLTEEEAQKAEETTPPEDKKGGTSEPGQGGAGEGGGSGQGGEKAGTKQKRPATKTTPQESGQSETDSENTCKASWSHADNQEDFRNNIFGAPFGANDNFCPVGANFNGLDPESIFEPTEHTKLENEIANNIANKKAEVYSKLQERLAILDERWLDGSDGGFGKATDKGYIYAKAIVAAYTVLGEEKFGQYFPETYREIGELKKGVEQFIGSLVKKADQGLYNNFGEEYTSFKAKVGSFSQNFDKNTPEIVQDFIKISTGIGLAKGAGKLFEFAGKPFKPHVDAGDIGKTATKIETGIVKAGTDAGSGFKHFTEIDANLLKREINLPDDLNSPKLRSKFEAHKKDFGMDEANFNKENAALFKEKIRAHIGNSETIPIAGQYTRGGVGDVVHYYNPKTEVDIIKDKSGDYVSGWKLSEKQQNYLKETGKIGGDS